MLLMMHRKMRPFQVGLRSLEEDQQDSLGQRRGNRTLSFCFHISAQASVFPWGRARNQLLVPDLEDGPGAKAYSFLQYACEGVTSKVPACISSFLGWGRSRAQQFFLHRAEPAPQNFEPDCACLRQLVFCRPRLSRLLPKCPLNAPAGVCPDQAVPTSYFRQACTLTVW